MGLGDEDLLEGKLERCFSGARKHGESILRGELAEQPCLLGYLSIILEALLGEGHGDKVGAMHPQTVIVAILENEPDIGH